ncbi:MAG TPA: GNAT family N-acetyltransferase [Mycobacteriales bacterium]|nr:GNAT family N-acetyltransferase [Mycobacteriales bacterium]
MHIRDCQARDLPVLITLTVEAFRPLFEQYWPALLHPAVFAEDHAQWEANYHREVPGLHDPAQDRYITLAEDGGQILGFVGWHITGDHSGRLQLVAVDPSARRRQVGDTICRAVLDRMRERGVRVVHVGTGGDDFHAPARGLYESLGFSAFPVVDYTKVLGQS